MHGELDDKNIEFNSRIDNDINCFKAIPDDMKQIIIYCHNLGSDSMWALRFCEELYNKKVGIISFDLPGHGLDSTDFKKFNLTLCLNYLNIVINYVKRMYPNVKINLLGSSFGSYIILNRLNIEKYNSVLLMSPCVKIIDYLKTEHNLSLDYYNNHEYKLLYGKVKLYKETYLDFLNNDVFDNKKIIRNNDIFVIHGEDDRVINISIIEEFCKNLNIPLKKVENAPHEFYSFLNQVNKFVFDKINNS